MHSQKEIIPETTPKAKDIGNSARTKQNLYTWANFRRVGSTVQFCKGTNLWTSQRPFKKIVTKGKTTVANSNGSRAFQCWKYITKLEALICDNTWKNLALVNFLDALKYRSQKTCDIKFHSQKKKILKLTPKATDIESFASTWQWNSGCPSSNFPRLWSRYCLNHLLCQKLQDRKGKNRDSSPKSIFVENSASTWQNFGYKAVGLGL